MYVYYEIQCSNQKYCYLATKFWKNLGRLPIHGHAKILHGISGDTIYRLDIRNTGCDTHSQIVRHIWREIVGHFWREKVWQEKCVVTTRAPTRLGPQTPSFANFVIGFR